MSVEFCDTNILVYAYDLTAGTKHEQAKQLVGRLWKEGRGAISMQVLQELFVVLTRKISPPLPLLQARHIVAGLATWRTVEPSRVDLFEAIDASASWKISFWDAMILIAANKAEASVVWSEDLSHEQTFGRSVVRNPFHIPSN